MSTSNARPFARMLMSSLIHAVTQTPTHGSVGYLDIRGTAFLAPLSSAGATACRRAAAGVLVTAETVVNLGDSRVEVSGGSAVVSAAQRLVPGKFPGNGVLSIEFVRPSADTEAASVFKRALPLLLKHPRLRNPPCLA
eukprot:GHVU01219466.1.p1 GENE.GHVU01219466.1~~GHVU01219466.1.p1  ORF type:complete len:138 (+),score=1.76 GHVU01219466.1:264-677(+)